MNGGYRAAASLALAAALLGTAAGTVGRAPARWAVIVGINDYEAFGADEPGGDLRGAEYDALLFRDVLRDKWGYPPDQTLMLLGSEASKDAIRAALTEWLPLRVIPDDEVVFYFAGHGSQVLDDDGDEPDGLDETLCPWDVRPDDSARDIRDDELREWLSHIPSRNVAVVVDACHSGTVTRLHSTLRTRRLPRTVPTAPVTRRRGSGAEPESGLDALPREVVELSAAAPEQLALEGPFGVDERQEPRPGGAFTAYLVRALWEAPESVTYGAVYNRVAAAMRAAQLTQAPQFSGDAGRPAFGGGGGAVGTMLVAEREGHRITLTHGVAPTLLPGARLVTGTGAVIRVERVSGARAAALLEAGTVEVGAQISIDSLALPPPELRVDLSGLPAELQASLPTRMEDLEGLAAAGDSLPPQASFLTQPGGDVALLGQDGQVRRVLPSGPGLEENLLGALSFELVLREIAALENPLGGFPVEIEANAGSYAVGDEIGFRIRSEATGFLTLLDLGTSGSVTVLYPNPFDELGRIAAGTWVEVPGPGARFTVEGPIGVGAVRAIVTDRPLLLGRQPGTFLSADEGRRISSAVRTLLGAASPSWASGMALYTVVR